MEWEKVDIGKLAFGARSKDGKFVPVTYEGGPLRFRTPPLPIEIAPSVSDKYADAGLSMAFSTAGMPPGFIDLLRGINDGFHKTAFANPAWFDVASIPADMKGKFMGDVFDEGKGVWRVKCKSTYWWDEAGGKTTQLAFEKGEGVTMIVEMGGSAIVNAKAYLSTAARDVKKADASAVVCPL